MKRRQFVEQLGIGSAVLAAASVAHAAQGEHEHKALTGPLANATVSFGAWPVGTVQVPRDRFTLPFAPLLPRSYWTAVANPRVPTAARTTSHRPQTKSEVRSSVQHTRKQWPVTTMSVQVSLSISLHHNYQIISINDQQCGKFSNTPSIPNYKSFQ